MMTMWFNLHLGVAQDSIGLELFLSILTSDRRAIDMTCSLHVRDVHIRFWRIVVDRRYILGWHRAQIPRIVMLP